MQFGSARSTIALVGLLSLAGFGVSGCHESLDRKAITPQNPPPSASSAKPSPLALETQAAESGDAKSQTNMGVRYWDGNGVKRDLTKAVEWWEKAAGKGDARAERMLGDAYLDGLGVEKDPSKAVWLLQKAIAQGDGIAKNSFAWAILLGQDSTVDRKNAIALLTENAANPEPEISRDARSKLGYAYFIGDGVPTDIKKANDLWSEAAKQGDGAAQGYLGMDYLDGFGLPKDSELAIALLKKATSQEVPFAQYLLGKAYVSGDGVPKDTVRGAALIKQAAIMGVGGAQDDIGLMYANGEGVAADNVLAYAWFNISAAQGSVTAKFYRDRLKLSPESIREAEALSSSWKGGQELMRVQRGNADKVVPAGPPRKIASGTAFIVNDDGDAVTNNHVVAGCESIRVGGRKNPVAVVTADTVNDLALLHISGGTGYAATISNSPEKMRQGDPIAVYGFPLNAVLSSEGNLTSGVVSAITGLGNNTSQFQLTAPIQPGSSGSPVLNNRGEVVGVVVGKVSDVGFVRTEGQIAQDVNFAISGQVLRAFLDAHSIKYQSGSFALFDKSGTELAEEAKRWTVLVECWR